MKRLTAILAMIALVTAMVPFSVAAAGTAVSVTDYDYVRMVAGTASGNIAYTAYEEDGTFVLGTLTASGEVTRENYTAEGWNALFADPAWTTTIHGDAGALCPYASSHADNTVCPYLDVLRVTLTHTASGTTLENYYIPSEATSLLPEGSVHFCFGRYGYTAPITLKWDKAERYMALKNDNGRWGVYDTETLAMVTGYDYSDMSTPYGDYVKVSNGTSWARLDLRGVYPTNYRYDSQDSFSIREEIRAVDGGWCVFSKDNEAVSPLIAGDYTTLTYDKGSAVITATHTNGTTSLLDVNGETITSYEATYTVRYLHECCYAVEQYTQSGALLGTALLRIDDAPSADDTVLMGDVNFDGRLNTSDVRLILLKAVSDLAITDRQQVAADMDADSMITTTDARMLLNDILR